MATENASLFLSSPFETFLWENTVSLDWVKAVYFSYHEKQANLNLCMTICGIHTGINKNYWHRAYLDLWFQMGEYYAHNKV